MKKSTWPFRVFVASVVVLLVLVLVHPAGALSSLNQPEPTPRLTPTPQPFMVLVPTRGVSGDRTEVAATGGYFPGGQLVKVYWHGAPHLLGEVRAASNGDWELVFTTPIGPVLAAPGLHRVVAIASGGAQAEAFFEMIAPTATPTPTNTRRPTDTYTPTPVTPSPTPTQTPTPSPSPTLRPVTPIFTVSPISPTKAPTRVATIGPTRTNTPLPGTRTPTYTPSITPTPTETPGPGTPSVTPQVTPTPVGEMSDTGAGWGTIFLWGFVLAGLVVVFRLLRVRGLQGQG